MSPALAAGTAERDWGAAPDRRHRPEHTLLYQIVEQHYPAFVTHMARQERPLPDYVQQEFEDHLCCGRLEHGFLRVRCDTCHAEHRVAFSCRRRGFCPGCGARRMVESAALLVDEVFPSSLCASGCRAFRIRCVSCSPAVRGSWAGCSASSIVSSPAI